MSDTYVDLEPFTCLKADLKEVNEGVFLCRMRFANRAGRKLLEPEETGRRTFA